MSAMADLVSRDWSWADDEPVPTPTPEQEEMLRQTLDEIRASPLCTDAVMNGGKAAVWRYLEGAQWRLEPVRGKRVSEFFVETLQWRKEGRVDSVLERAQSFEAEAASGKLFLRGRCRLGRPLIWVHAGRENGDPDPEADVQFLIYTVERAIASMKRQQPTPESKGQFCVVIDCSSVRAGGRLPSLPFMRDAVSMLALRYPSRLGKLFVVNSGLVVYYLWQAVSLLLSPVTRDKIVVVSGTEEQQREVLLDYMSEEAFEGGRLGCPGAPPFDVKSYVKGGDAGGATV